MSDDKKLVIKETFTLKDVACYEYFCGRCGKREAIPQIVVKTFSKLAPDDWCCVACNDDRSYYCTNCAKEIGIM